MRTLLTPVAIILLCYLITVWAGTAVHWLPLAAAGYLIGGIAWAVIYAVYSVGPAPSKELRRKQEAQMREITKLDKK